MFVMSVSKAFAIFDRTMAVFLVSLGVIVAGATAVVGG